MTDAKSTKEILIDLLKQNKAASLLLGLTVLGVVFASLLPPQILRFFLDHTLANKQPEMLWGMAGLYFASFALIALLDFLKGVLLTSFGQKIVRRLRSEMTAKLARCKASYFSKHPSGEISAHFLSDVDAVDSLFSEGILSMAIDCLKILSSFALIWILNSILGLFVLAFLPYLYLLTRFFRKRIFASQSENLRQLHSSNNHIAESMKNILMLKSFHKEEYMKSRYDSLLRQNYQTRKQVNFYDSCYSPLIQILTAAVTAILFCVAGSYKPTAGITVGTLAAVLNLLAGLFAPMDSLGTELQSIQKGISGLASLDSFLLEQESQAQDAPLDLEKLRKQGASFEFQNLSFSYERKHPIITRLSLSVAPCQKLCFVGRTGVGKTTLFKLITGLLSPTSGSITLNGIEVSRIPADQKRSIFGYVEQSFSFVRGDLWAQIGLWDPAISHEQIKAALRLVGLEESICKLPQAYETVLDSQNSFFSQGQKQLLGIARAIVTDPPILLLDEITANLDSITEAQLLCVLKKAGQNKTILSISHRPSSLSPEEIVVKM